MYQIKYKKGLATMAKPFDMETAGVHYTVYVYV